MPQGVEVRVLFWAPENLALRFVFIWFSKVHVAPQVQSEVQSDDMGIVLKNLKLLPNGKYQFRRVWPADVRLAVPELGRELKRTFADGLARDSAIVQAVALNREFDATVEKVRGNGGELPAWELQPLVQTWFDNQARDLTSIVRQSVGYDRDHNEILVEETAAELEIERIIRNAEKRSGNDYDGNPGNLTLEEEMKITLLNGGRLVPPPLTIQQAYELYTAKKNDGRVDRYARSAVNQFIEFSGNVPIGTIRSSQVMDWLDYLVKDRGHVYETVKKRLGALKAIVNFAKRRDAFRGENPFVGHKVPDAAKAPKDRLPFHHTHLAAIDHHLATSRVRDETRWVIQLLKYTGCRPSEIGGLKAEDLSLDGDVPFALVRWSEDRRLKTRDSERRVPLLGPALDAARAACARHATGWLFPKLAPTSNRVNDNQALSARINKVIRKAGVPASPQLVCYSFRHTMAAALDQTPDLAHAVRERVLGRQRAQYGARELPIQESVDALTRAIPLLGKVDEVLYGPELLAICKED